MKRYGMPSIPNKFLYMRSPDNEWQGPDSKRKLRSYLRGRARMQEREEMRKLQREEAINEQ
jgi:hypothetical protein